MVISILLFAAGFIYANVVEAFAHWFFLHKLGKNKKSIFAFHWHRHHRTARLGNMMDDDFKKPWLTNRDRFFEVASLTVLLAVHLPIVGFIPAAFCGMATYLIIYYNVHKLCHIHEDFGKKFFKGHYYHHMGQNQDSNWGTVIPLVDYIVGSSYLNKKNHENRNTKAASGQ